MRSKPSQTRVVGYRFEGEFNESAAEAVLQKAQAAGIVSQFDTGRGHLVWFNGPPGAALREVRKQVKAIVDEGC